MEQSYAMRKAMRVTERNKWIKAQYIKLTRIGEIAQETGLTRQGVWKVLKGMGVDTSMRQSTQSVCPVCGIEIRVRRAKQKQMHNYCSPTCYREYLVSLGENYKPSSYHSRLARATVASNFKVFDPSNHIVHHVDKDNRNNNLGNLWVFANQSDHLKYHRGMDIKPLWKGANNNRRLK